MRTCYLHLGMPKTGSSSIQAAFDGYDRDGLTYAKLQHKNHGLDLAVTFSKAPHMLREFRWQEVHSDEVDVRVRRMRNRVEEACAGSNSVIFSGEAVNDKLKPDEFAGLVEKMRSCFDKVVAIAYVRPLASLVSSDIQQRIRLGHARFKLPPPNYRQRLQPVIDSIGRENTILVRFDRADLVGGDIVTDFSHRLGLKEAPKSDVTANESLSAEAIGALYAFNRFTGPLLSLKMRTNMRQKMELALKGIGDTKFGLAPELIEKHLEEHREDVAWIEDVCGFDLKGRITPVPQPIRNQQQLLELAAKFGMQH